MRLAGKVAVITGAASGFGRPTVLLFAREGANVVVADINESEGRRTVEAIKERSRRVADLCALPAQGKRSCPAAGTRFRRIVSAGRAELVMSAVVERPMALIVLRSILGFSPSE